MRTFLLVIFIGVFYGATEFGAGWSPGLREFNGCQYIKNRFTFTHAGNCTNAIHKTPAL